MKKMILVAAPPACGKNYVSELICNAVGNISYFDKDDLNPLLRKSFALCKENVDMDGEFYLENLRSAEYNTLFNLSFSALRFSKSVLVNAPLLKEIRSTEYMKDLKEKAHELDAELILVWIIASSDACYERMKARNSDRDVQKLANWDEYRRKTDYTSPDALEACGAVDKLFIFDNKNNETASKSLEKLLDILEV